MIADQIEVVAVGRVLDVGRQQVEGSLAIVGTSKFDANLFNTQLKKEFTKEFKIEFVCRKIVCQPSDISNVELKPIILSTLKLNNL